MCLFLLTEKSALIFIKFDINVMSYGKGSPNHTVSTGSTNGKITVDWQ